MTETGGIYAGHCPHDEMPDEVNAILHDWLRTSSPELAVATVDTISTDGVWDGEENTGHDDAAAILNGEIQLVKSDWFAYFNW